MLVLVIAFAAVTATPPPPATDWKKICSSGGGMDAYACAEHELEGAGRRLKTAYRKTLGTLPDKDAWDARKTKAQLVQAQKAWLAYRDANCDFQGGMEAVRPTGSRPFRPTARSPKRKSASPISGITPDR